MKINKNSGEIITLEEAKSYTHSFQRLYPQEKKAFFVGKDRLLQILEQPDCLGIRIYNGYNDDENTSNKVLIGVDSTGNDVEEGIIVEKLVPCPSVCTKPGGL